MKAIATKHPIAYFPAFLTPFQLKSHRTVPQIESSLLLRVFRQICSNPLLKPFGEFQNGSELQVRPTYLWVKAKNLEFSPGRMGNKTVALWENQIVSD